jgi:hypothetical protein
MDGGAVANAVWMQSFVFQAWNTSNRIRNMLAKDGAHAKTGESCPAPIAKHGLGPVESHALFFEQFQNQSGGFGPKWTDAFLPAFPMKADAGWLRQLYVRRLQSHNLADTAPGVKQKAQQGKIPLALARRTVYAAQHSLKLVEIQMLNLAGLDPFEGNAKQMLGLRQVFGVLGADISEEAVDGAQAHIAGAGSILPVAFQVAKEGGDPLHGDLFYCEGAGITLFSSHKF